MAKLYFRYGAMGSSKTANAIMVQYNYQERGQNALMLKPRLETRDGANLVASRSGLKAACRFVEELDTIPLDDYDCIIVDEAQFLKKAQVQQLVDIVDDKNIPVICYGLRADFQGNLFEGSHWLMAWADSIEEIKTVCWCGRKAICNARLLDGKVVKTGQQIQLGGNESYVALCRRHWKSGELAPTELMKIERDKKRYMDLLLDADPSEAMIDRYLDKGDMYLLKQNGRMVCLAVVLDKGEGVCELCNFVTVPDMRGFGYGTQMLERLFERYAAVCHTMEVGTDRATMRFYEKSGFEYVRTLEGFFTDNYEPIIENGETLTDMFVLSRKLKEV